MRGVSQGTNAWGAVPVSGHVGEAANVLHASVAFWAQHRAPWASTWGQATGCDSLLWKQPASRENGLQLGAYIVESVQTVQTQPCIPESFARESAEPQCGRAGGIGESKAPFHAVWEEPCGSQTRNHEVWWYSHRSEITELLLLTPHPPTD